MNGGAQEQSALAARRIRGRAYAFDLAGTDDEETAAGVLIREMQYKDLGRRRRALLALTALDSPRAIGGLIAALDDENHNNVEIAIWALVDRNARQAAPAISRLLDDLGSGVRTSAVYALGHLGVKSLTPRIIARVNDPERDVRGAAVWALGSLGPRGTIRALRQARREDPDEWVRTEASAALQRLGHRPRGHQNEWELEDRLAAWQLEDQAHDHDQLDEPMSFAEELDALAREELERQDAEDAETR